MSLKHRLLFVFLFPLFAVAQDKLTLTGKVTGLKEGAKVALVDVNKPTDTLGSGIVKKGVFVISAQLKEPTLASLEFPNTTTKTVLKGPGPNAGLVSADTKHVMVFLDNSNVKVNGDLAKVDKITVTGSPTHKDFAEFQTQFNPLFEKIVKINQRMQMPYGENTDELYASSKKLQDTVQDAIDVFLAKHNSSVVSTFLLAATINLKDDVLLTEKRLNQIAPAAIQNLYGNYVKQVIDQQKPTAVGVIAQDFVQADTSGSPVSLSSFRGKYVLLDFWASWCGPCRQENPNVVNTYNKFKEKNFTVLGVSLDRPGQKEKWLQAIHMDGLTWTHVSDLQFWQNAVALQYHVESIPQNFLIGPDGKIVAKNLRGAALEAKLCEVLGCN